MHQSTEIAHKVLEKQDAIQEVLQRYDFESFVTIANIQALDLLSNTGIDSCVDELIINLFKLTGECGRDIMYHALEVSLIYIIVAFLTGISVYSIFRSPRAFIDLVTDIIMQFYPEEENKSQDPN